MVYSLDTLHVTAKYNSSYLRGGANESLHWDMEMLHYLPQLLGNSDPMHYAQLLPGVQTCSEYNSGLYIQGCDNAHNLVSIDDVPIYNASHLLGFFSVFNASHFPKMFFSKNAQSSSISNRLGGVLSMQSPDSILIKNSTEYTIGPMSVQGSLRLRLSDKASLFVSLRSAYLNLLYGKWMKVDENSFKYDFSDINMTYLYSPNIRNKIKIDLYMGYDRASLNENSFRAQNDLKWHNEKLSLTWNYDNKFNLEIEQTFYVTNYQNNYKLKQRELLFSLPSSITDYAYKGVLKHKNLLLGTDLIYHDIQPQNPNIEGVFNISAGNQPKQSAIESALFVDYDRRFSDEWAMRAGARYTYYTCDGVSFSSLDPMLTIGLSSQFIGNIHFNFRIQHQYLFQTGFSNMGLPTEFWFGADNKFFPQSSCSFSLAYDVPLLRNDYHFYVELFHKRLANQVEYNGTILDFLTTTYSLDNTLLKGKGVNYGINVMLNKVTGKLTGWVSYTCGRALRRYKDENYPKCYPANHERIHELNVAATYQHNSRFSSGIALVYASGTPFTSPKYIYWLGNQFAFEYGEHNASRLKPYFRLDLSVNYNFVKTKTQVMGINFSVYNATSTSNDLYYRFSYNEKKKSFAYKPTRFIVDIMPSISIYHRF